MNTEPMGAAINAVGTFREVTGIDSPSTVVGGLRTGYIRAHKGRLFILLKAAGTIADGLVVMKDTTSAAEITVVVTTGAAVFALGVNNTGVSISSGQYFWALKEGLGYGDITGTVNDGDGIAPAANGEIGALATNGLGKGIGVAVLDGGATVQSNLFLFSIPGAGSAAS